MFIYKKNQVEVEEASDIDWSSKYCQAQDDPHFLTFDGRYKKIDRHFDENNASLFCTYTVI